MMVEQHKSYRVCGGGQGVYSIVNQGGKLTACYDDCLFAEMVAGKNNAEAEITQLKELNREMANVLKEIATDPDILWTGTISDELLQRVNGVLAKAEEG